MSVNVSVIGGVCVCVCVCVGVCVCVCVLVCTPMRVVCICTRVLLYCGVVSLR